MLKQAKTKASMAVEGALIGAGLSCLAVAAGAVVGAFVLGGTAADVAWRTLYGKEPPVGPDVVWYGGKR